MGNSALAQAYPNSYQSNQVFNQNQVGTLPPNRIQATTSMGQGYTVQYNSQNYLQNA